jgi:hypothetical protein
VSPRGLRIASAGFLVVAAVFVGVALAASWRELRAQLSAFTWRFDPLALLGALVLGTAALVLTAATWERLHRDTGGGEELERGEGIVAWLASNLGRYLPGKVWQLAGLAAYVRGRGDSAAAALSSSLALQAITLLTGAAFGLILAGGSALGIADDAIPRLGLLLVALTLLLHPASIRAVTRVAARLMGEDAPARSPRVRSLVRAAAALCIVWCLHGAGFWLLLRGVAGEGHLPLGLATGVFATSYVVGYLILVAPGGLVAREGAMATLLVALRVVPWGAAVGLAGAARLWTVATELTALTFAAALRTARPGRNYHQEA